MSNCDKTLLSTFIEDLAYRNKREAVENIFPDTKEELIKDCKPPIKPWSEFHAKVWSACNFTFKDQGLHLWIKFRGGIYHPENIEQTKDILLKTIKKHHIQ